MHLGYISRWKTSYTLTDHGTVQMNLTTVDPVSEAGRLQRILEEQEPTQQEKIEIGDLIKMLTWAATSPLRHNHGHRPKGRLYAIRKQEWEHVIKSTDLFDLPIVASGLTDREVSDYASKNNLIWVAQRGWLFGGYYRDADGNCYYPS